MKYHIRFSIAMCLSGIMLIASLSAEQKQFAAGFEDNWSVISSMDRTRLQRGKEGFLDIVLEYSSYEAAETPTDMLLHFEQEPLRDSTGNYSVEYRTEVPVVPYGRVGESAAFFSRGAGGIRLRPLEKGPAASGSDRTAGSTFPTPPPRNSAPSRPLLFQPGSLWSDFTIEFWLRPEYLENGETVLSWKGQRKTADGVQYQSMSCTVEDRMLRWEFENFFLHPESDPVTYLLTGRRRLVPERWSHHMVRFDARTGMIEYLIDGQPEAVMYATIDSKPDGTILLPFIGTRTVESELVLGADYAGLMDEFRLAPGFVRAPLLHRLPTNGGEVILGPISLEEMGSQLLSIDVDSSLPPGSSIFSYYRLADTKYDFELENPDWTAFTPGKIFTPAPLGAYLQVRCDLFPDGLGITGPSVSSVTVNYRPNLPPPPPVGLSVIPRDGAVHLSWSELNQRDLGGYLVYYGRSPGVYRGDDAAEGSSPIDVGKQTELSLSSLQNGQLYYFAVAAYDTAGPAHRGSISRELSSRPSAYYGE